jgi:hypothetical protein
MNKRQKAGSAWIERLATRAAAIISIVSFIGIVINFAAPYTRVSVEVIDGSWRSLGALSKEKVAEQVKIGAEVYPEQPYYEYEFNLKIRNHGNTSIGMSHDELKLLEICSNTPKRPRYKGPSVILTGYDVLDKDKFTLESMRNNVLQLRGIKLRFPLFSQGVAKVRLISPISDMGGVNLSGIDPVFDVRAHNRNAETHCSDGDKAL